MPNDRCYFFQLRREGMRLFLVWYQILMENATEECHQTFACLVPKLGSDEGLDMDIFTFNSFADSKMNPHICPISHIQCKIIAPIHQEFRYQRLWL